MPVSLLGASTRTIRLVDSDRMILGTWGTMVATTGFASHSETSTSLPRSRVYVGEGGEWTGEGDNEEEGAGDTGSDFISSSSWGSGTHRGGEESSCPSIRDTESTVERTERQAGVSMEGV